MRKLSKFLAILLSLTILLSTGVLAVLADGTDTSMGGSTGGFPADEPEPTTPSVSTSSNIEITFLHGD